MFRQILSGMAVLALFPVGALAQTAESDNGTMPPAVGAPPPMAQSYTSNRTERVVNGVPVQTDVKKTERSVDAYGNVTDRSQSYQSTSGASESTMNSSTQTPYGAVQTMRHEERTVTTPVPPPAVSTTRTTTTTTSNDD